MKKVTGDKFTKSGLPKLGEEELEYGMQSLVGFASTCDGVQMLHDDIFDKKASRILYVTNLHLFLVEEDATVGLRLELRQIGEFRGEDSFWSRKSQMCVTVRGGGTMTFLFESKALRDKIQAALGQALKTKAWVRIEEEAARRAREMEKGRFDAGNAGVTGILRRVEERRTKRDEVLGAAFTELDTLMAHAKDLVRIAEQLRNHQSRVNRREGNAEDAELEEYLLSMGIASPVTKATAGSLYYNQLARQLSDFLEEPLRKWGFLSLPVVYTIYNRARGTELVSPNDVFCACSLFEKLALPVRLRELPSGSKVVQSEGFTDKTVLKKIERILEDHKYCTAVHLSRYLECGMTLALEFLKMFEQDGILCRDVSSRGLLFWPNRFLTT